MERQHPSQLCGAVSAVGVYCDGVSLNRQYTYYYRHLLLLSTQVVKKRDKRTFVQ